MVNFTARKNRFLGVLLAAFIALIPLEGQAVFGIDKSIRNVRVKGDPAVYYLSHEKGVKKAYVNASSFLSYGNKWNQIKVIPKEKLEAWPDAEYLKLGDCREVYMIYGTEKYRLGSYEAENYCDKALSASAADLDQYGGDETLGRVKVSLGVSEQSLRDGVRYGANRNALAKLTLKAGKGDSYFESLKLRFSGSADILTVKKVVLEDESGNVLAVSYPYERDLELYLSERIYLGLGVEKKFYIYADLDDCEKCEKSNIVVEIRDSESVMMDGALTEGDFPLQAKSLTVERGKKYEGYLEISQLEAGGSVSPGVGRTIGEFDFKEVSLDDTVEVQEIVLVKTGNVDSVNIKNIRLIGQRGGVYAEKAALDSNGEVLLSTRQFVIRKGMHEKVSVVADIMGGNGQDVGVEVVSVEVNGSLYGQSSYSYGSVKSIGQEDKSRLSIIIGGFVRGPATYEMSGESFGSFVIANRGEQAVLKKIRIQLKSGDGAPALAGSAKIIDGTSGSVLATFDVNNVADVRLDRALSKTSKNISLVVMASAPASFQNGYYEAVLKDISYNDQSGTNRTMTADLSGPKYRKSPKAVIPVIDTTQDNGNNNNNNTNNNGSNANSGNNTTGTSTSTTLAMAWPVTGRVSYGFHDSRYMYDFLHEGVDIVVGQGTSVRSAEAGEVVGVRDGGMADASFVVIRHNASVTTLYGHLSRINVKNGDKVARGQVIGLSGGTPGTAGAGTTTTGPHLHFEVMYNGVPVDPMRYLR